MICGGGGLSCAETLVRLCLIGLSNGAIIALNAMSVTLVYSIVRIINFAHGDMFSLATVLAASAVIQLGLRRSLPPLLLIGGLVLALALTMAGAASLNVAVERIGFRPFRGRSRLAPLMATIGISFMLYQGALFLRTVTNAVIPGEHRSVPGVPELTQIDVPDVLPNTDLVKALGITSGVTYPLKDLLILLGTVGVAFALQRYLTGTRTGRSLRACADDALMARLVGINDGRTIRLAFAISGALAGVGAWVYALYYTSPYLNYGAQSGLFAFTAAILGGVGRPFGALGSGLALGILGAYSDYFTDPRWTPAILLALLVGLLLVRRSADQGEGLAAPSAAIVGTPPRERRVWPIVGLALALAAFPLLNKMLGLNMLLLTPINLLIYAILAIGLNVTVGWAGMLDLGYAACYAVGAYAVGVLSSPNGRQIFPWTSGDVGLALLTGGLAGAAVGLAVGLLTARLHNEYMALATFSLGVIVLRMITNLSGLTNGASGISGVPPLRFFGWRPSFIWQPVAQYYVTLGICLLTALGCALLWRSRIGRAWAALRADEVAAASLGVPPARMKTLAFAIGGLIAGLAGALFATSFSYLVPNSLADFRISALVLVMVVLGGSRGIRGVIVGALLITGYDLLVIPYVGNWFDRLRESTGDWFWSAINPRGSNFLSFGLLLYLSVLYRARRAAE